MKSLHHLARSHAALAIQLWDQFWFTPRGPYTMSAIRIATGAMLLYTHLVLAMDLMAFVGPDAWTTGEVAQRLHQSDYAWTYLWHIDSPAVLWIHHGITLIVMAMLTIGVGTRIVAPLAWLLHVMYMHRLTGSLFGLDQMTTMLAFYLMLCPCGAVWSVDAWFRERGRAGWLFPCPNKTIATNIATRLLQVHLCIIYLFGGIGKMRGEMWWDGTALWFALSNYEYQSLDMTWIGKYPLIFAALSHMTVFWETFYCALVWPRLTRPLVIATAFMVHGGIAMSLGMITFGVIMIVANCVFISPEVTQRLAVAVSRLLRRGEDPG